MKKHWKQKKWKRHLGNRSRRALKRKRRKREEKRKEAKKTSQSSRQPRTPRKQKILNAPRVFSLIENTKETLAFFGQLRAEIKRKRRIFLNLSRVEFISCDSVSYVLSTLEYNSLRGSPVSISGNAPANERCSAFLQNSGFYRFVKTDHVSAKPEDPEVFSIKSDQKVSPEVAAGIKRFAMRCLHLEDSRSTKAIYKTIIECMSNTRNHAYYTLSKSHRWWLTASYDSQKDRVSFAFLDNGAGIPSTVRRKFAEKLKEFAEKALRFKLIGDHGLIMSALRGEFRSKTKEIHRGKGLPDIYQSFLSERIHRLVILSKRGFVECGANVVSLKERDTEFAGTMLYWEIRKEAS